MNTLFFIVTSLSLLTLLINVFRGRAIVRRVNELEGSLSPLADSVRALAAQVQVLEETAVIHMAEHEGVIDNVIKTTAEQADSLQAIQRNIDNFVSMLKDRIRTATPPTQKKPAKAEKKTTRKPVKKPVSKSLKSSVKSNQRKRA